MVRETREDRELSSRDIERARARACGRVQEVETASFETGSDGGLEVVQQLVERLGDSSGSGSGCSIDFDVIR